MTERELTFSCDFSIAIYDNSETGTGAIDVNKILSSVHRTFILNCLVWKGYLRSLKQKNLPMGESIDFVVTWVDGNDPAWQAEKAKYDPTCKKGNTDARYRDWDQFMYWFRAVEKYAPWVRYVHLVTWGHLPAWLNIDHPKLRIVNHKDYIPSVFLPTFSSIPLELNIFRIPGLSEHFVYFNDDMYVARPTRPEDFFSSGEPKHSAIAAPVRNYRYNGPFAHQLFSNIGMINSVFDFCASVEKHPEQWFSHYYGKQRLYNKNAYCDAYMSGMFFSHLGVPYRKSTCKKVWYVFEKEMNETCLHRFRTPTDIMHQLFSLWEIMNGTFCPVEPSYYGMKFGTLSKELGKIEEAFSNEAYRMICLNDSVDVTEENYPEIKAELDRILQKTFPEKSSFEK